VDINGLVEGAVEHSALKVNKRGGVINMILDSEIPIIHGDENHISNLIHNLLDNANKYSPESPNINIETKLHRSAVEISITDDGIGMSKEELKRIFDKFYRVSTGNLHDVKGFGLGLSYVKAIVDAHKGKVEVKSELGEGSTFSVFFPFSRSD
jgi:two-component system phosphate regulon sensor histidine kinase PhoR